AEQSFFLQIGDKSSLRIEGGKSSLWALWISLGDKSSLGDRIFISFSNRRNESFVLLRIEETDLSFFLQIEGGKSSLKDKRSGSLDFK
ncbi:4603_t:CDS:10, partial [Funneliformis caledonium]